LLPDLALLLHAVTTRPLVKLPGMLRANFSLPESSRHTEARLQLTASNVLELWHDKQVTARSCEEEWNSDGDAAAVAAEDPPPTTRLIVPEAEPVIKFNSLLAEAPDSDWRKAIEVQGPVRWTPEEEGLDTREKVFEEGEKWKMLPRESEAQNEGFDEAEKEVRRKLFKEVVDVGAGKVNMDS